MHASYLQGIKDKDCPNYHRYEPVSSESDMAAAYINGSPLAPNIKGTVTFTSIPNGVRVCVYITGLPNYQPATASSPQIGPFGFHIHENGNCTIGNPDNPFAATGGHWNPDNQPHGNHAGDFPVLFSNSGIANMCFFTNRFKVSDILGKSVVIHQSPDDYRTQPAGNSGKKIACGVIRAYGGR